MSNEKVEIDKIHLARLLANTKKAVKEGTIDEYEPDREAIEAAEELVRKTN